MARLTDRSIRAAKAEGKDQFLSDGGGLYLRVAPSGSKFWVYRYKNTDGKTRWFDLGVYPAKTLVEARAETAQLKLQRRDGVDPVEERQRQEERQRAAEREEAARLAAENSRMRVRELFEKWMLLEISKRADQGAEIRRMFEKDVLPEIGDMPIEDVRKGHIAAIVDKVLLRGGEGRMAAVTLAGVRQMFRFAIERDYLDSDPTSSIRKSRIHKPTERERVLSNDEIRLLVKKLPSANMCESSQLAMMAMMSTCCRVGEICKARLADVDLVQRTWRIRADVAKNRREHIVFLSGFAIDILGRLKTRAEQLGTEWLMPARNKLDSPVCEKSLSKQIGDRQRSGQEPMKGRSPLVDALVMPGGKWTSHDLRRTGATLMGDLGIRPDVIEKCLNHKEQNKMKRIYQRQSYNELMREAWGLLGERLELLTRTDSDNVILLDRSVA